MPCVFTGAAGSLAGRERRGGGAGKRGRPEKPPNSTEQKEREREVFPLSFVLAELVVLRKHPFCWTEYERGTRHLLCRAPPVYAARFCSEGHASAGEFFYISELDSTAIKAEGVAGYGLRSSEAICPIAAGKPGYYCNFCGFGV
jgi:hypothetical protein